MAAGVTELQILGDELDVDQAAGRQLDIPQATMSFFRLDRSPHFDDIGSEFLRLALLRDHLANRSCRFLRKPFVAGDNAGPGQSKMLPRPRFGLLI